MFSSFASRLMLGIYIFVLLSIPVGAYFLSQSKAVKKSVPEKTQVKTSPNPFAKPTASPSKELLSSSKALLESVTTSPAPAPSLEIATTFGPTLSFSAALEGRTPDNYTTRLFVGIVEGQLTVNPKFLLSFTVDLPASGKHSNLSLAGLTPGSTYTALLKGSAQIATSSAFIMSPTISNLNNGQPLTLLSGDLNEDNVINTADYSIVQKITGATAKSSTWLENADIYKDGIINAFDLGIINKNMNQTGASGAWTSPLPKTATPSASLDAKQANLNSPPAGSPDGDGGYWLWIPQTGY